MQDEGNNFVFLRLELFDFSIHGVGFKEYLLSVSSGVGILLIESSGAGGVSVDPMLDGIGVALWTHFLVTGPASVSNRDFCLAQGVDVGDAVLDCGVVDVEGFLDVGAVLGRRRAVPWFVWFLGWLNSLPLARGVFVAAVNSGAVHR